MKPKPTSFEAAIAETAGRPRHLLLGNGFSIGVHTDFGYPRLYQEAIKRDPSLALLFRDDSKPNFELALKSARTKTEAERIRAALIRAVAAVHPHYSLNLTAEQCRSCIAFLELFASKDLPYPGSVFTTNYDLLLHWVISRQPRNYGTKHGASLSLHDGFDHEGLWSPGADARVYYLHGAVHIHQRPYNDRRLAFRTDMLRYGAQGVLTAQVDALLQSNDWPLFVAEGSAPEKSSSQKSWHYLKNARKKFRDTCDIPTSTLFTYGHSFGDSDNHISSTIAASSIKSVYFGAYNGRDRQRAEELSAEWNKSRLRDRLPALTVYTFDATSCDVWGALPPE